MGFFNQSLTQVRDVFASMTPAARITSALLAGVIGVSLAYLFQGYAGSPDEYLFGGEFLSASEADRVEQAFAAAGLAGHERDGGRIRVPKAQKAAYLAAVADAGALPANFNQVMEQSLDLGPFVDRDTKRQRLKAAREQQLSMIVSMMAGVEDAKVMYDVREARGFGKEEVTATVSVLPAAGQSLDAHKSKMIRSAVASAVAGLSPGDVTILNLGDGTSYDEGGAYAADSFEERYFQTRIAYEDKLRNDLERFLRYIPGVQVTVSAELDDTLAAESRSTRSESDPVPVHESTTTESTTSTQLEDKGRPGLVAQGPNRQNPEEAVAKNEHKVENQQADTENFIPFNEEKRQLAGLVPKKVKAAIAIPTDYLVRVWRDVTPDAAANAKPTKEDLDRISGEVTDKIKNTITPLFPKELGDNPYPNIAVTFFQSLTPDPVEKPSMLSHGLVWASQNSGALIMAGLALAALMMLRSLIKSIPPAETSIVLAPRLAADTAPSVATAAAAGRGRDDGGSGAPERPARGSSPAGERSRPKLKLKRGASLKDDLADIVRDDPDSAAAILRSWIGQTG